MTYRHIRICDTCESTIKEGYGRGSLACTALYIGGRNVGDKDFCSIECFSRYYHSVIHSNPANILKENK